MNKKAFMAGYLTDKTAALNSIWEDECRAFGAFCKHAGIVDFSDEDCIEYLSQSLDKTASSEDKACALFMEGVLQKEAIIGGGPAGSYDSMGKAPPQNTRSGSGSSGGGWTKYNPALWAYDKYIGEPSQKYDMNLINKGYKPIATQSPGTALSNVGQNIQTYGGRKIEEMKNSAMGAFGKYAPYLAMGLGGLMMLMGGRRQQQPQGYGQGMAQRGPMAMYNAGVQSNMPAWRGGYA
jgi:hypothetical protein